MGGGGGAARVAEGAGRRRRGSGRWGEGGRAEAAARRVACAADLAARDLEASRFEDLDGDVGVTRKAEAQLHLVCKLPLGVFDLAAGDLHRVSLIILVLVG